MRAFWMLIANMAIYSYSTQTNQVHFITHRRYTGFTAAAAALVQTAYGVVQVFGRLGVGWVSDRIGRSSTMRLSQFMMGIGWVIIAFMSPATAAFTLPLYYLFYGLAQAACTVRQQTIVANYFGARRFATIRGFMNPISIVESLAGPLVAAMSKDRVGQLPAGLFLLAPIIMLRAITLTLQARPCGRGGIAIAMPPRVKQVVDVVRTSGGVALAVSEARILAWQRELARVEGIYA